MSADKSRLRIEVLELLRKLEHEDVQYLSKQVITNLNSLFESENFDPKYLGIYYPVKGEVNCLDFETRARLCFPSFDELSNNMSFRESKLSELEVVHAFGKDFKVPLDSAQIVLPEVIFIPGVAFDRFGGRIGRGKGYYDRYLSELESTLKRRVIKIGICFNQQLLEKVHLEKHDQIMDFVVTNNEVVKVNQ